MNDSFSRNSDRKDWNLMIVSVLVVLVLEVDEKPERPDALWAAPRTGTA